MVRNQEHADHCLDRCAVVLVNVTIKAESKCDCWMGPLQNEAPSPLVRRLPFLFCLLNFASA
jgi:hypothetical protein